MLGDRYNNNKPKWSLVSWKALEPMVRVLEFGAKKYTVNNWKGGLDDKEIMESAMRHLTAMMDGEIYDSESQLPHSAHVMCNMLFYNYHYLINNKNIK